MALRIEFTLLKPVIWLLSAGMFAIAALGFNYYQAQMDATRTLAMKLGLPNVVAIEEFRLVRDSNQMYEVQLAAKVRPEDTRLVVGSGDPALFLIPLYATNADFASSTVGPFGFYIAQRNEASDGVGAFGLTEINTVGDAVLVNVVGTRIDGQASLAGTNYNVGAGDLGLEEGAFLIGDHLVERATRLGNRDVTPFRDTLILLTVIFVGLALVSHFHGRRRLTIGKPEAAPVPQASSPRSKKAFLPLASQDEIRKTDEVERARRRRSRLSFVSPFSADPVEALKNQR